MHRILQQQPTDDQNSCGKASLHMCATLGSHKALINTPILLLSAAQMLTLIHSHFSAPAAPVEIQAAVLIHSRARQ